jgi:hypothetical protein
VPGVIAKLFGNLKSTDEAGRQARRCLVLGRCYYRLNDNLSAVKMIDQEKSHECEKNQQDCHTSPRRSAVVSCLFAFLGRSPLSLKAIGAPNAAGFESRNSDADSGMKSETCESELLIATAGMMRGATLQR